MTKSRVLKLEHGLETVVTECSVYTHAMKRDLTGASAVEANNVEESMSFFRGSDTFG
jgi:hypothetical protein